MYCTSCAVHKTVTEAVVSKVQEICRQYLDTDRLLPIAEWEVAKTLAELDNEKEINVLKAKISSLTVYLDQVYMDKLSGILDEDDFQRIYAKVKAERASLEQRLTQIDRPDYSPAKQAALAKTLAKRFVETIPTNRELLVSFIERVELTQDKQVIIKFRFRELEAIS